MDEEGERGREKKREERERGGRAKAQSGRSFADAAATLLGTHKAEISLQQGDTLISRRGLWAGNICRARFGLCNE